MESRAPGTYAARRRRHGETNRDACDGERAPQVRRARVIHRKLWCDDFRVDVADAIFTQSAVAGSEFQNIYHVDMTAHERLITPCRFQDFQLERSIQGPRTVGRFF